MFARKFSSDGISVWPLPWRARNATRLPRSVPRRYGPDGGPNGVSTVRSLRSVSSAMSYRPLPPMIPISVCSFIGALSLVLSYVARRDGGIMLEKHQRVLRHHVSEERLLRSQRVHGIQVVAHDPRVVEMRGRRQQIRREHRRPAAALDPDRLVVHAVAAGPLHAHARH